MLWAALFVGLAAMSCGEMRSVAQVAAPPQVVAQLLGSLTGTVVDADGALVPEAHITLSVGNPATERETLADAVGQFRFEGVAAGSYSLRVTAHGMAPAISTGVLRAGEDMELTPISLRVGSTTDIEVSKTQEEIAEVELYAEEQQRILGFAPNFFVSYNWQAEPLTKKQKYKLAARAIIDPINFLIVGGDAGLQQAQNDFPGFGQGSQGYAKRYGATYANLAIGTMLGGAALPSLFHQDPRYFYNGTGSKTSRALYALSTAFRQRGDNGKWQVGYSTMLGDLATGAISNLYYAPSDRDGATLTLENGLLSIGFDGVSNLVQEFVFRKFSTGTGKKKQP